ncbi:MAG: hypothetical protein ACTSPB_01530 [Candidatus Thorarchaeota archaeon]
MRRKSPRKHTVHTKHPRYNVPQYPRGSDGFPLPSSPTEKERQKPRGFWEERYYSLFTQPPPYREPENLKYVPEEQWQYAYFCEKSGRGSENALRYIDPTTTATPMFDNMLENPDYFLKNKGKSFEIIWMSPQRYFETCAKNRTEYSGEYASARNEREMVNDELARKYANMMEGGTYFPMPNIDEFGGQEGRHRARALEMLGVKRFPVMRIRQVS